MQALLDKAEINDVLITWGQARDRGEWDILRNCFQPDATIHIAWISGPASEFIERSADMLKEFKDGEHAKHFVGPGRVQLNGARAYSQSHVNFVTRVIVDDILFDWEFWGQFHDLVEKRADGAWRIFRRTMVYEKDRLDPVHPERMPEGYLEAMDLSGYAPAVRFLSWRNERAGRPAPRDPLTVNSEGEVGLIGWSLDWLGEG
jgi:hypothetical protein